MKMYDLIGDIHGYADQLTQLLRKMGYTCQDGHWQHPSRKAIFVGDFIDRGPAIREVLTIVKGMTDNHQALAVMGNHEFNAIAYAHQLSDGTFLRPHNETNNRQHHKTLEQFAHLGDEWNSWLQWFYTLPLYLDLGQIRVVHACWDQGHIDWLDRHYGGRLTPSLLVESHRKGTKAYQVIEETLKGKEMNVPEHCAWKDQEGHYRTANRIKWWLNPRDITHESFLFNCPDLLKDQPLPDEIRLNVYPADAPPVFFGHYWLEDQWPVIQRDNVICLDYSVAKGGSLVAYRWSGEDTLHPENFVVVAPD